MKVKNPFPLKLILFLIISCTSSSLEAQQDGNVGTKIAEAAMSQVGVTLTYDPEYVRIPYPGGDIDRSKGVCTDVVVRAFRSIGIDLQKEIHTDMRNSFPDYPQLWGMRKPDPNIDHRRVQNQSRFFERRGKKIGIRDPYLPGDIVAWRLASGLQHIGVVSTRWLEREKRYAVVHNIGRGARLEDVLHAYTIIGHYRW